MSCGPFYRRPGSVGNAMEFCIVPLPPCGDWPRSGGAYARGMIRSSFLRPLSIEIASGERIFSGLTHRVIPDRVDHRVRALLARQAGRAGLGRGIGGRGLGRPHVSAGLQPMAAGIPSGHRVERCGLGGHDRQLCGAPQMAQRGIRVYLPAIRRRVVAEHDPGIGRRGADIRGVGAGTGHMARRADHPYRIHPGGQCAVRHGLPVQHRLPVSGASDQGEVDPPCGQPPSVAQRSGQPESPGDRPGIFLSVPGNPARVKPDQPGGI